MTRTTPFEHVQLDEVKPGDLVASLLCPTWYYEVLEVKPDGNLSLQRTLGSQTFVVDKNFRDVKLVEKGRKSEEETSKPVASVAPQKKQNPSDSTEPEISNTLEPESHQNNVVIPEAKPDDSLEGGATIDPPSSTNNVSDADAAALSIEDKADANEAKPIEPDTIAAPKKATSELENLSAGDIIGSLLVPDWSYKVVEVQPNNKLQCERRLSSGQSFNVELDVSAVYLIEKASQSQKAEQGTAESGTESEKVVKTPEENTPTSDEKPSPEPLVPSSAAPPSSITPEDLAELIREAWSWEEIESVVAGNEQHKKAAWKLLSKEEQNHVLILKLQAKQEDTQSEPSVPSSTTTTAESGAEVTVDDFSYGDTIEVISARNGEERVGDVGIVRVVHEHGVTVESNGVLTYWYPEELKLLVRSDEL
jgi:hypothetical protein